MIHAQYKPATLPEGFVYAKEVIPSLRTDLRYYSSNNFVGQPIDGYIKPKCILTKEAAAALKKVQELNKDKNSDKNELEIYEKIITRSLFGNINASRNSA